MCGCTLHLGSPHKNSDLGKCSTRQPTVYSYTASHRSPCIRVDSPTLFHHHHHDHYIPTHTTASTLYHSKHDINQLLHLLGLWFAYYYDKMIGHAKDMGSTMQ